MLKILLVDDEPLILRGLVNIIKSGAGFSTDIVSAIDGLDALDKLDTFQPDIVITDIYMPEMNGFEFIKEVQNRGICHRFVMLTGYDDFELVRKAMRFKALDYLLKPVDKEELLGLLAKISAELEAGEIGQLTKENAKNNYSESIRKVLHFIDNNYKNDISLESVADVVHLHPNYLCILFKKETGVTFIQYLHTFRVNKAKDIILGDDEIAFNKIAYMVGYDNPCHFYKIFKKFAGVTPGQFRELRQ